MKFVLILSFVWICSILHAQSGLIEYEKITVGKNGTFQTIEEALVFKSSNVHFLLDSSVFINDNGYLIQGDHVILEGNGATEIQCRVYYDNVLWLNGSDITVRNLRLKHFRPGTIEGQNCSGRVIGLDNCTNVLIENCDINGCGLAGIHDNVGNSGIIVRNNYIHNNSFAAFTNIDGGYWMDETDEMPGFTFVNNRIENNGPDRVYEYTEDEVKPIYGLPDSLRVPLEESLKQWEKEVFTRLLQERHIKMSCKDCSSIALRIALVFDLDGRVIDVVLSYDGVRCGSEALNKDLRQEMLNSLKYWEFPVIVKDIILECHVGRVLKC